MNDGRDQQLGGQLPQGANVGGGAGPNQSSAGVQGGVVGASSIAGAGGQMASGREVVSFKQMTRQQDSGPVAQGVSGVSGAGAGQQVAPGANLNPSAGVGVGSTGVGVAGAQSMPGQVMAQAVGGRQISPAGAVGAPGMSPSPVVSQGVGVPVGSQVGQQGVVASSGMQGVAGVSGGVAPGIQGAGQVAASSHTTAAVGVQNTSVTGQSQVVANQSASGQASSVAQGGANLVNQSASVSPAGVGAMVAPVGAVAGAVTAGVATAQGSQVAQGAVVAGQGAGVASVVGQGAGAAAVGGVAGSQGVGGQVANVVQGVGQATVAPGAGVNVPPASSVGAVPSVNPSPSPSPMAQGVSSGSGVSPVVNQGVNGRAGVDVVAPPAGNPSAGVKPEGAVETQVASVSPVAGEKQEVAGTQVGPEANSAVAESASSVVSQGAGEGGESSEKSEAVEQKPMIIGKSGASRVGAEISSPEPKEKAEEAEVKQPLGARIKPNRIVVASSMSKQEQESAADNIISNSDMTNSMQEALEKSQKSTFGSKRGKGKPLYFDIAIVLGVAALGCLGMGAILWENLTHAGIFGGLAIVLASVGIFKGGIFEALHGKGIGKKISVVALLLTILSVGPLVFFGVYVPITERVAEEIEGVDRLTRQNEWGCVSSEEVILGGELGFDTYIYRFDIEEILFGLRTETDVSRATKGIDGVYHTWRGEFSFVSSRAQSEYFEEFAILRRLSPLIIENGREIVVELMNEGGGSAGRLSWAIFPTEMEIEEGFTQPYVIAAVRNSQTGDVLFCRAGINW